MEKMSLAQKRSASARNGPGGGGNGKEDARFREVSIEKKRGNKKVTGKNKPKKRGGILGSR